MSQAQLAQWVPQVWKVQLAQQAQLAPQVLLAPQHPALHTLDLFRPLVICLQLQTMVMPIPLTQIIVFMSGMELNLLMLVCFPLEPRVPQAQ